MLVERPGHNIFLAPFQQRCLPEPKMYKNPTVLAALPQRHPPQAMHGFTGNSQLLRMYFYISFYPARNKSKTRCKLHGS